MLGAISSGGSLNSPTKMQHSIPRAESLLQTRIHAPSAALNRRRTSSYSQLHFGLGSRLPLPRFSSTNQASLSAFPVSRREINILLPCIISCASLAKTEMSSAAESTTGKKTIHLIRHGQAEHNVAGELNRLAYLSYDYLDASLTVKGWQQVGSLHNHIKSCGILDTVQVVVVSPMMRAMQTAAGSFGGHEEDENGAERMMLMADGVGNAKHEAISRAGVPPMVAVELCREHLGVHPCDKRRTISTYKKEFPGIDFALCGDEEDLVWLPDHRETEEELAARATRFWKWLMSREETDIAVVAHSGFLFSFMNVVYDDRTITRFNNCEMRTLMIDDKRAEGKWTGNSTDFLGGLLAGVTF